MTDDDAAIDFANLYYDDTQRHSAEYGSSIYIVNVENEYGNKSDEVKINDKTHKIKDGKMLLEKYTTDKEGNVKVVEQKWVTEYYTYTKPNRGAKYSEQVIISEPDKKYEIVGDIHTHTSKGYPDFSDTDQEEHYTHKVTSYLVNSDKQLIKWPWGGKPDVIYIIDEKNIDYSDNPYSEDMWINYILNLF
jgi:hypothetical protein